VQIIERTKIVENISKEYDKLSKIHWQKQKDQKLKVKMPICVMGQVNPEDKVIQEAKILNLEISQDNNMWEGKFYLNVNLLMQKLDDIKLTNFIESIG